MNIKPHLIMQAGFAVLALGAFLTVDYVTNAAVRGKDFTVGTYLGERISQIRLATSRTKPLRVADMFPPAPDGWSVREFEQQDLALVTGAAVKEKRKTSAKSVLLGASTGIVSVDKGEYRTYTSGDRAVLVHIGLIKASALNPIAGDGIKRMMEFQNGMSEMENPLFATVNGMQFRQVDDKAYGVARRIEGKLGYQVDVDVVTTEDDDTILAILSGLNVGGLNQMLEEPIAGMGEGGVIRFAALDPEGGDESGDIDKKAALGSEGGPAAVPMMTVAKNALSGLFGGKPAAANVAAAAPVVEPKEITCSMDKGFKRCKIGG